MKLFRKFTTRYFIVCVICVYTIFSIFNVDFWNKYIDNAHRLPLQRPKQEYMVNGEIDKHLQPLLHRDVISKPPEHYIPIPLRLHMNGTKIKYPFGPDPPLLLEQCNSRKYNISIYPSVSIIITFHENEQVSHILHTLHSIWQNTPLELIEEVIVIDDASRKEEHKEMFENYVMSIFGDRIRIIRNLETVGLIKNRQAGIRMAKAGVVVSMDAHMEVRKNWLEALLYELEKDHRTIATSNLDWMKPREDGTWIYERGPSTVRTVFWLTSFLFTFFGMSKEEIALKKDFTEAIECPCTVGTIWAMYKSFFTEIGEFDEGMWMWGAENIDIVIRAYLWGGKHVNVPCSHAAHLEAPHQRAYRAKWGKYIQRNYKRVAEVWFDEEYKDLFYYYNPQLKDVDCGDITERLELKKRAPYEFKHFLLRGYPDLGIPQNDTFAWGKLINKGTPDKCFFADGFYAKIELGNLNVGAGKTCVMLRRDGVLQMPLNIFQKVDRKSQTPQFIMKTVYYLHHLKTRWLHKKGGFIKTVRDNWCVTGTSDYKIQLAECNNTNPHQQWTFEHYTPDFDKLMGGAFNTSHNEYYKQMYEINK